MQPWTSEDELQHQLLSRKRLLLTARKSFTEWCRACGYEPARHHQIIIQALEEITSGSKRKVMLLLPPGSAKSTYGSQLFPPWYLSQHPLHSILAASHTMELAERWGRRARDLIVDHEHELRIRVSDTNAAAGRWQLAAQDEELPHLMGEYLAAGTDRAIAGFRADLGLIDDPVKSRESVMSETQRNKVWDWYTFDFRPRLKPGARQILIMTRWHQDDLGGRILAEEGTQWHVIKIPMIAEDENDPLGRAIGEMLWPEWFTEEMIDTAKRDPFLWLSLYQQNPTTEEGTFFKRSWLQPVPPSRVPPRDQLRIYGGSDYAVKTSITNDFTAHLVVGLDPGDRPWLLDVWRERTTSDVWVDAWCEIVKFYKPMTWAEEQGQIISGVGPFLEREASRKKAFTERLQFVSRQEKSIRAQSIRGHIATHGLWYDAEAPWRADFEAELLSFPSGKHDDQVDALGLTGQLLDMAVHGRKPAPPAPKKVVGYRQTGRSAVYTAKVV